MSGWLILHFSPSSLQRLVSMENALSINLEKFPLGYYESSTIPRCSRFYGEFGSCEMLLQSELIFVCRCSKFVCLFLFVD